MNNKTREVEKYTRNQNVIKMTTIIKIKMII